MTTTVVRPAPLPLDTGAAALMVALCLIWGLQQTAVKSVAGEVAPTWQMAIRCGGAALCTLAWMRWREGAIRFPRPLWAPGLLAGALFAAEFAFIAWGLMHTTASRMSVFLYTAPVFTAIGMHVLFPAERLSAVQWGGIAMAFGGVVLAFADGLTGAAGHPLGDLLGVAGGLMWAATTLVIRRSALAQAPATQTLLVQLAVAAVGIAVFAALRGDRPWPSTPSALLWASMAFQVVVVAFGSYLCWFWLLRRHVAARLSAFTLLTPLFGVAFGALLLDEPLSPHFLGAAALVVGGLWLVNRRPRG